MIKLDYEILTAWDLAVYAAEVRRRQREYFRTRDKNLLAECVGWEQRLDQEIFRILSMGRHGSLTELAVSVAQVRSAQVEYFRTRTRDALMASKDLEKSIDSILTMMLKSILVTNQQIEMWNEKGGA